MKSNIINLGKGYCFYVKFRNANTFSSRFFVDANGLYEVIREHSTEKGIEFIKAFDTEKGTFKKVSKEFILSYLEYNTEAHIYLSNHFYFKSKHLSK